MISSSTYKNYSDYISEALDKNDALITLLENMQTTYNNTLLASESDSKYINDSNNTIDYANSAQSKIYDCVNALQSHVQVNSGTTVDIWLTSQAIKVKQRFATASIFLGFNISSGNIE